jgi:hypothetical protein
LNSIVKDAAGNYLASSRFLHAFFYIHGHTGDILWQFGGKQSDFTGNGTSFAFQHHGRWVGEVDATSSSVTAAMNGGKRRLSLFDNTVDFNFDDGSTESRGLFIELDFANKVATIITEYRSPGGETDLLAFSQGSVQMMQDETYTNSTNVVVGYGFVPAFAEFKKDGTGLKVVHFGISNITQNYRVFKKSWVGLPTTSPDAAILDSNVYVSWNGATEVKTWTLLQGSSAETLSAVANATRSGFETSISLKNDTGVARVLALDSKGNILGKTALLQL